jgi:hypothetical protein
MTEPTFTAYRHLFSQPRLAEDLLRGFARESWTERLDYGTLELRSETYPGAEGAGPVSGALWRLRGQRSRSPVYLMLEVACEVVPFMAVRLRTRLALLYEDLIRCAELPRSRRLPWVLPVVIYAGPEVWHAPRELADLIDAPLPLRRFEAGGGYLLLDALREPIPELAGRTNLVSRLFELERARTLDALNHQVSGLGEILASPDSAELRLAFAGFLSRSLLPRRFPGAGVPALADLEEVGPVLAEEGVLWSRREQERLRELGRRQGRAEVLRRQLEHRFGPLTPHRYAQLERAEAEQILAWGERTVAATSLEEVFAR